MKNKLALITGGSRGIGKGIVNSLAILGYSVAFTYKDKKTISEEYAKNLNSKGFSVAAFNMNQSNRLSIQKCINQVHGKFNQSISVLINNAAIAQEKPFNTISDEDWENMLKTNLQGPFMLIQEVLTDMMRNKFGRIINITSVGGQWGGFNQVHYAASKAALINLTQSIARIYSKDRITTNAVAIGLVKTDLSSPELESDAGKKKIENIPIGRIGTIEEIANTVSFLCSEDASYITGQTINVNGGMYFG